MTFINEAPEEFRKMDEPLGFNEIERREPDANDHRKAALRHRASDEPPFSLCERTVAMILVGLKAQADGLASQGDMSGRNAQAIAFVESLLPKPDRAKELFADLTDEDEAMDRSYADGFAEACRRIVSKGMIPW